MKQILVLNAGSSSIKYQLFRLPEEKVLAKGLVERIGESDSAIKHEYLNAEDVFEVQQEKVTLRDHAESMQLITKKLSENANTATSIDAVGHRVVHGGEHFNQPAVITEPILQQLKDLSFLAPLHNPVNILGIEVATSMFPDIPQVAVFDTAFHQSIPDFAYRFAIPKSYYEKHSLRVYGFHGTSHAFVAKKAAEHLQIPFEAFNAITIHLGNGCSITAIKNGQSVDTSMGLTPLGGLVMGTRSGDIDPSLIFFLHNNLNMDMAEIDKLLNKGSGLKGLTGDQDVRTLLSRYEAGDEEAKLAIEMYTYRIKKYLGAYLAALGKTDAVVFTGGVGENSQLIRAKVCDQLESLGIELENSANEKPGKAARSISTDTSRVKVMVVPTNEELEIARQTFTVIGG